MTETYEPESVRAEMLGTKIESGIDATSLEVLRDEITQEAQSEISTFKEVSDRERLNLQQMAEQTGTTIASEDIKELQELDTEADTAYTKLVSELETDELSEGDSAERDAESINQLIESAKSQLREMAFAGLIHTNEFTALLHTFKIQEGEQSRQRTADEIDEEALSQALEKAKRVGVSQTSPEPESIPDPEDDVSIPDPEDDEVTPEPFVSGMKERVVDETPEKLDARKASKEFLFEERKSLAEEIKATRRAQRERLEGLKLASEIAEDGEMTPEDDTEYGHIAEAQSVEATAVAERLVTEELSDEDGADEEETINQLIDTSTSLEVLKKKLEDHYAKADALAQEKFESVKKSVEQVLLRNQAFIVHVFLANEKERHNANSNISARANVEDDIDILLSLEPSISTSSVKPGSKHGLWGSSQEGGVVLGGGDIQGVRQNDGGTITGGIKRRSGEKSSSAEIDEKVSDITSRGYNELVVNNPKVFGFFKNVYASESGKIRGFSSENYNAETKLQLKKEFLKYINYGKDRGLPPFVMTPDRRLYEFVSIDDEGIVTVGNEITPEQVAIGNAGLPEEGRKEIGKTIIQKNLFRKATDQLEAKRIIADLGGEEGEQVLLREEYLAYVRDNKGFGEINAFPKELFANKEFMMEAGQYAPSTAYRYAGEILKHDTEYVIRLFEHRKNLMVESGEQQIYSSLPEDLKKNELIALAAIDSGDYEDIDISFSGSAKIMEKMNKITIEKLNPDRGVSREIGKAKIVRISGLGVSIQMGEKIRTTEYIELLNETYPKYKFATYEYENDGIEITKLSE